MMPASVDPVAYGDCSYDSGVLISGDINAQFNFNSPSISTNDIGSGVICCSSPPLHHKQQQQQEQQRSASNYHYQQQHSLPSKPKGDNKKQESDSISGRLTAKGILVNPLQIRDRRKIVV